MALVKGICDKADGGTTGYMFWCPGCKGNHSFRTAPADPDVPHLRMRDGSLPPVWEFNGDEDCPTFEPSLLYPHEPRCHLFVRNGTIEYCADCDHALAGQTVKMVDWEGQYGD